MRARRIGLAPIAPNAALREDALAVLGDAHAALHALLDTSDPHRPIMLHMTPQAMQAFNMRRLVRADPSPFPRLHLFRWWR